MNKKIKLFFSLPNFRKMYLAQGFIFSVAGVYLFIYLLVWTLNNGDLSLGQIEYIRSKMFFIGTFFVPIFAVVYYLLIGDGLKTKSSFTDFHPSNECLVTLLLSNESTKYMKKICLNSLVDRAAKNLYRGESINATERIAALED